VPSDGFKLLEAILQVEDTGPEEREDFFPEDDEYFRYNPDQAATGGNRPAGL
jgi:hypothetical protein